MSGLFRHELIVCKSKGTFKAYCRCGGLQTPKLETEADTTIAYKAHLMLAGIKEQRRADAYA